MEALLLRTSVLQEFANFKEVNIFIDDPINQLYCLLSIPFIIFYNGEKVGYSRIFGQKF